MHPICECAFSAWTAQFYFTSNASSALFTIGAALDSGARIPFGINASSSLGSSSILFDITAVSPILAAALTNSSIIGIYAETDAPLVFSSASFMYATVHSPVAGTCVPTATPTTATPSAIPTASPTPVPTIIPFLPSVDVPATCISNASASCGPTLSGSNGARYLLPMDAIPAAPCGFIETVCDFIFTGANGSAPQLFAFYEILRPFDIQYANWTHATSVVRWTTPGGDFAPTPVFVSVAPDPGWNFALKGLVSSINKRYTSFVYGFLVAGVNGTTPSLGQHFLFHTTLGFDVNDMNVCAPTGVPTLSPTRVPTGAPTTSAPTYLPTTSRPSATPTTSIPTLAPTQGPTGPPTLAPSSVPTLSPTPRPSAAPTLITGGIGGLLGTLSSGDKCPMNLHGCACNQTESASQRPDVVYYGAALVLLAVHILFRSWRTLRSVQYRHAQQRREAITSASSLPTAMMMDTNEVVIIHTPPPDPRKPNDLARRILAAAAFLCGPIGIIFLTVWLAGMTSARSPASFLGCSLSSSASSTIIITCGTIGAGLLGASAFAVYYAAQLPEKTAKHDWIAVQWMAAGVLLLFPLTEWGGPVALAAICAAPVMAPVAMRLAKPAPSRQELLHEVADVAIVVLSVLVFVWAAVVFQNWPCGSSYQRSTC